LDTAIAQLGLQNVHAEVRIFDSTFGVAGSADLIGLRTSRDGSTQLAVVEVKSFTAAPSDADRRAHWRQVFLYRDIMARELRLPRDALDVALLYMQGHNQVCRRPEEDTPARPSDVLRIPDDDTSRHRGPAARRRVPRGFFITKATVLSPDRDDVAARANEDFKVIWDSLPPRATRLEAAEEVVAEAAAQAAAAASRVAASVGAPAVQGSGAGQAEVAAVVRRLTAFAAELEDMTKEPGTGG